MGGTGLKRDYVGIAEKYARDVVSGAIPNCQWVRAACQRHLDDLEKPGKWTFDYERAAHICRFAEMLPHVKGRWASPTFILEPWQCFVLTSIFGWVDENGMRRFRKALIVLPRKNGKALDVNTPIPTPSGWTTMGQIQPGDTVLDAAGNPTGVVAVSEVFTDHDCYELTFSNGERIVADAGHRWQTSARVDRIGGNSDAEFKRARGILAGVVRHNTGAEVAIARAVNGESAITRVRTTDEIFTTQKYGKRNDRNHSIALSAPLQLPEAILPIDPYILGIWLGDGTSACAAITCGSQDKNEMMRLIQETGYGAVAHARGDAWNISLRATEIDLLGDRVHVSKSSRENLAVRLRCLNVLGNKHIPEQYLRASVDQRLSLLQGLMDTDGTIDKKGRVLSYTSVSEQLALGVAELLSTLGIKYGIRQDVMTCNGRLVPGTAYDIQFMAFRDELPVFRLDRKLDRMRRRSDCTISPRSKTIQISDVRKVDPRPVKCIQVESESHLFLCGRTMIPTHNSALASIVALYGLALDKEPGAEVFAAATTRDQAKIVWDVSRRMVQKTPRFCEVYGIAPLAHSITVESTGSSFKPLSRDADSLEGLNPHFAIIDELHAHSVREVFDVLDEATGARRQPLMFIISTEGDNPTGVFAEQVAYAQQILEGRHSDDSYFAAIYTIDSGPYDLVLSGVGALEQLDKTCTCSNVPSTQIKRFWLEGCAAHAIRAGIELESLSRSAPNIPSEQSGHGACAEPATNSGCLTETLNTKRSNSPSVRNGHREIQSEQSAPLTSGGSILKTKNDWPTPEGLSSTELVPSSTNLCTPPKAENAQFATERKKLYAWITATSAELFGASYASNATRLSAFLETVRSVYGEHLPTCEARNNKISDHGIVIHCDADDWTSSAAWRKANPNLGVSVFESDLEIRCRQAEKNPASQSSFLTKRLNVRVGAGEAFFNMLAWKQLCYEPMQIEDFYGKPCIIALDLASKHDIAASILYFRRGSDRCVFGRFYVPGDSVERGNPNYDFYRGWADRGFLTLTEGNVIDFEFIKRDLLEDCRNFSVTQVGFDPFQATQLSTEMKAVGLPMLQVPQTVRQMSEPMKEIAGLIMQGRLKHDGNPALGWMLGNCVAKTDAKENVYPRKTRAENKIDGAVALIMAAGVDAVVQPIRGSIYNDPLTCAV